MFDEKIREIKNHITKSDLNVRHIQLIHEKIEVDQRYLDSIDNKDQLEVSLAQWLVLAHFEQSRKLINN